MLLICLIFIFLVSIQLIFTFCVYLGHAIGVPVMRTRSGSGDHTHKHGSGEGGIRRSVSDSSLFKKSKCSIRTKFKEVFSLVNPVGNIYYCISMRNII